MSMLRNVLTYMGLGPDEDYDDAYPYEPAERVNERGQDRSSEPTVEVSDGPRPKPARHGTGPSAGAVERRQPSPGVGERRAASSATGSNGERRAVPAGAGQGQSAARRAAAARRRPVEDEAPGPARRGRHDLVQPTSRPLRAVPPAELGDGGGITIRSVPPLPTDPPKPAGPVFAKPRSLSPQSFGDAKTLADEFKSGVPVIMNLQGVPRELARRLIDFASGICYALEGGMEKVAPQVFLLTPRSVEISAEDRRRLEKRDFGS